MLNGMFLPAQMAKPPAPHELLKIIRCGCKIDFTTRCTLSHTDGNILQYAPDVGECRVKTVSSAT